jgi:AraC family transcriptional regulator
MAPEMRNTAIPSQASTKVALSEQHGLTAEDFLFAATERFPVGRVLDVRSVRTPSATAMMLDYDRDFPVSGNWFSKKIHFFDMSFSKRPPGARGYFDEAFTDYRGLGKIFFLPAGHRYHGEGGQGRQQSLSLFLRARPHDGDDEAFGSALTSVLPHCLRLESDTVRGLLTRIAHEVVEPGLASDLLLEGLSLTLLAETARLLQTLRTKNLRKGGLSPQRLRMIEERIRSGDRSTSIAELAAMCHLSSRQLIRAFRAETGETIGAFVQRLTMERAQALLSGSDRPIGVIAAELGFASAAAFSTAFHRASGQYPRDYRITRQIGTEPVDVRTGIVV